MYIRYLNDGQLLLATDTPIWHTWQQEIRISTDLHKSCPLNKDSDLPIVKHPRSPRSSLRWLYHLVSSNMAGWKIPERFMEVLTGKSRVNGPFSSQPCLITRGYQRLLYRPYFGCSSPIPCCIVYFLGPCCHPHADRWSCQACTSL